MNKSEERSFEIDQARNLSALMAGIMFGGGYDKRIFSSEADFAMACSRVDSGNRSLQAGFSRFDLGLLPLVSGAVQNSTKIFLESFYAGRPVGEIRMIDGDLRIAGLSRVEAPVFRSKTSRGLITQPYSFEIGQRGETINLANKCGLTDLWVIPKGGSVESLRMREVYRDYSPLFVFNRDRVIDRARNSNFMIESRRLIGNFASGWQWLLKETSFSNGNVGKISLRRGERMPATYTFGSIMKAIKNREMTVNSGLEGWVSASYLDRVVTAGDILKQMLERVYHGWRLMEIGGKSIFRNMVESAGALARDFVGVVVENNPSISQNRDKMLLLAAFSKMVFLSWPHQLMSAYGKMRDDLFEVTKRR